MCAKQALCECKRARLRDRIELHWVERCWSRCENERKYTIFDGIILCVSQFSLISAKCGIVSVSASVVIVRLHAALVWVVRTHTHIGPQMRARASELRKCCNPFCRHLQHRRSVDRLARLGRTDACCCCCCTFHFIVIIFAWFYLFSLWKRNPLSERIQCSIGGIDSLACLTSLIRLFLLLFSSFICSFIYLLFLLLFITAASFHSFCVAQCAHSEDSQKYRKRCALRTVISHKIITDAFSRCIRRNEREPETEMEFIEPCRCLASFCIV